MTSDLTLEDLARHSSLTLRTLRFYIQEGLLQGPDTHGKFSRYSQQHLDRLELIQRLKSLRLPIKEIRNLLDAMTPDEISRIREYQDALNPNMSLNASEPMESTVSAPGSSALEYIRSLEKNQENLQTVTGYPSRTSSVSKQPTSSNEPKTVYKNQIRTIKDQVTWRRIVIAEGVELNIREPMGTDKELKVRKLVDFTRMLFGSQQK
jgi:DNA-binding transcriptional MerR regulator